MNIQGFGLTDVGQTRAHNEDSFSVDNDHSIFIVADGVGGRSAGEVASKMAVDIIRDHIKTAKGMDTFIGVYEKSFSSETNRLASAIRLANRVVYEASRSKPNLQGMGSTVVVAVSNGDTMSLAHVGDSRAYLIRDGKLKQITDDHSLVMEQVRKGLITEAEAIKSDIKNVITRALGAEKDVMPDLQEVQMEAGDKMLICSDGLSGMVPHEMLLSTIEENERIDRACMQLINQANKNGGEDNITAVILEAEKGGILGFLKKLSV